MTQKMSWIEARPAMNLRQLLRAVDLAASFSLTGPKLDWDEAKHRAERFNWLQRRLRDESRLVYLLTGKRDQTLEPEA